VVRSNLLVAILANVLFAELAVPLGREEPLAVFRGALANKLALLRGFLDFDVTVHESNYVSFEFRHVRLSPGNLLASLDEEFLEPPSGLDSSHGVHGGRHEAPLALKENLLAVELQGSVSKRAGTGFVDYLTGPEALTFHAVRIRTCVEQEILNTTTARGKGAKGARDPLAVRYVVLFATYGAICHFTF
jgi:hypothetical protein